MPRLRTTQDADVSGFADDTPTLGAAHASPNKVAESSGEGEAVDVATHYAGHLRDSATSMFMHTAMAPYLKGIDWEAFRLYRDRLLTDSGAPTDPVEVMVLEELALAHFCVGLMACKTTNAGQANVTAAYASAMARLIGEVRRNALALQAYRHANRQLGRDPLPDAGIVMGRVDRADGDQGKNDPLDELGATTETTDAGGSIIPYPQPEAVGDQPPQPREVARPDARGKGAGSRRGPAEPSLGARNGAAIG